MSKYSTTVTWHSCNRPRSESTPYIKGDINAHEGGVKIIYYCTTCSKTVSPLVITLEPLTVAGEQAFSHCSV